MRVPGLITTELGQAAVKLALPLIDAALQRPEVGDGGNLHIVIARIREADSVSDFEGSIILETAVSRRSSPHRIEVEQ